jgi:virginiamycin A acetyltransferase
MLSEGSGIRPGLFVVGTSIGNYSCFAAGLQVLPRNHPPTRVSQHPLFFNSLLGLVKQDTVPLASENPLLIGHDVWIGLNVIICPGCKSIGNGAMVGAGAIVTKDVAPYTIVAGNPARPIRSRFSPEVEAAVAASHWWELPLVQVVEHLDLFTKDLTKDDVEAFARAFSAQQLGAEIANNR